MKGNVLCAIAVLLMGCPKKEEAAPPAVDAGVDAQGPRAEVVEPDDEVRPVYPIDAGPPDPLAKRLCHVLHDVQEEKRSKCCGVPPAIVLTSECERVATAALSFKAITLDPAAIDACAAALDKSLEGCEWPGPFPPALPTACQGLVKGTLGERARCRSSLECQGTLRCRGVGPTTMGRCTPPAEDGERCGGSADALASLTRQDEDSHPECAGWCNRNKCAPIVAVGGACTQTVACGGAGKLCVSGKCAAAAPAKAGEACPGGACEPGSTCISGKCVERKKGGAACTTDFECVGGCNKGDAGKGTCGMKCSVR